MVCMCALLALGFLRPRCFENGRPEGSKINPRCLQNEPFRGLLGARWAQDGRKGRLVPFSTRCSTNFWYAFGLHFVFLRQCALGRIHGKNNLSFNVFQSSLGRRACRKKGKTNKNTNKKRFPNCFRNRCKNLTCRQRLHIVKLTADQLDKFFICFETF